jgi:hypothetical protein
MPATTIAKLRRKARQTKAVKAVDLDATKRISTNDLLMASLLVAKRSNRQRASRTRHKVDQGKGSLEVKAALNKVAKVTSRIPKAWADTNIKREVQPIPLDAGYWSMLNSRPTPIIKTVGATKTFKALTWRGEPCLWDDCIVVSKGNEKRWQPIGKLPDWQPALVTVKPAKVALDSAVQAWRQRVQAEHAELLIQLGGRNA